MRRVASHCSIKCNRFAFAYLRIDAGLFEIVIQLFLRCLAYRFRQGRLIAYRLDSIWALHRIDSDENRRSGGSNRGLHAKAVAVDRDRLRSGLP